MNKVQERAGIPVEGCEWIDKGILDLEIRCYRLADSKIHHKYKNDQNNPNYVPGLEYENYVLLIIPSGFKDLYHTIVESPELTYNEYRFMTKNILEEYYNINLNGEENG